jgi:hypothetical protein
MKLLGEKPRAQPLTKEGALITQLPTRQIVTEKVTDPEGSGNWYDGRVIFISNEEAVIVPVRCKSVHIYGAAARMARSAKTGLPKKMRKGNEKRLRKILIELVEHAKPR